MAQREVTILDKAVEEVAYIAYFIEGKGLPETSKKFVDDVFSFFRKLGDTRKNISDAGFVFGKKKVIGVLTSKENMW